MDCSAENIQLWNVVIQIGIIAILVILSNIIRLKIPFVKKALVPTSVLAGFMLLGLKYLDVIKIDTFFLDTVTYHGIALGFIALSLKVPKPDKQKGVVKTAVNTGAVIVSTYLVQGFVGLAISMILAFTIKPDLFMASGLLLPMGFGQGPGQANNVGSTYEALGFAGGKSYGLAIAAAGFIEACVVGVFYLNIKARKKKLEKEPHEDIRGSVTVENFQDENEMPISQSIDRLSIQMALVLCVYLFTYAFIWGITKLFEVKFPALNETVSPLLWGFNFIFGSLFAIITRNVMAHLKKSKVMSHQYQNNYLLSRISGLCFDVMIICGIASIDFEVLSGLWMPFIITVLVGGAATFAYLKILSLKLYKGYEEEAFLGLFGMLTGTISSGILLIREIDPNFETPAANNLVAGSGTGIALGAPVLVLIGLGPKSTGAAFAVLGFAVIYTAVLLFIIFFKRKKKRQNLPQEENVGKNDSE